MKWRKLGQLFAPDNNYPWMQSHAANPFVEILGDNSIRVYFTCRNSNNQSHIGSVDIDATKDFKVTSISSSPVVAPGEPGMFDDSGTAMGFLLPVNDRKLLYYLGWNLKVTVPWLNTIGLATWDEAKQKWVKNSRAPMMDRSNEDPFSISYPSVLADKGKYRMWYGSNLKWGPESTAMDHVIKYAESDDGIKWKRTDHIAVNLKDDEYALSKPFVILEGGTYKMWYSYRGYGKVTTYRIGYAESSDGLAWKRLDENVGIDVSESGWDSEMICYPCVFDWKGKKYMFYNGNGYGKTGFGAAVLE